MKQSLFTMAKLTIFYNYNHGDGSHHSFGSIKGARDFIEEAIKNDKNKTIDSYSIEEISYIPCKEDEPDGKLYLGVSYFEFIELKEKDEIEYE